MPRKRKNLSANRVPPLQAFCSKGFLSEELPWGRCCDLRYGTPIKRIYKANSSSVPGRLEATGVRCDSSPEPQPREQNAIPAVPPPRRPHTPCSCSSALPGWFPISSGRPAPPEPPQAAGAPLMPGAGAEPPLAVPGSGSPGGERVPSCCWRPSRAAAPAEAAAAPPPPSASPAPGPAGRQRAGQRRGTPSGRRGTCSSGRAAGSGRERCSSTTSMPRHPLDAPRAPRLDVPASPRCPSAHPRCPPAPASMPRHPLDDPRAPRLDAPASPRCSPAPASMPWSQAPALILPGTAWSGASLPWNSRGGQREQQRARPVPVFLS